MSKWRDLNQLKDRADAHCGFPAGFFRLRYFHGKQMRLADYVDEQRYYAGKMRFHNEKLHGAGILCGLKVSVLEPEGTLLRVARGAAIDDCGREIVVGFDQCVDVDAWFRRQAYEFRDQDDNPCKPDEENRVRICVVMRYSECAGGPEPAPPTPCGPPDPCVCGCGSTCACSDPCNEVAEYGRITEEFELKLMFWEDAKRLTRHALFPTRERIDEAVAGSTGGVGLLSALACPIRERCPGPDDGWLLLACFYVTVESDDPDAITGIEDVDHNGASQVLLSTETIQYLLAALYAEVDLDTGGPEIADITFRKLSDDKYQFVLSLTDPIEPATLESDASFGVRRLTATGWDHPAGEAMKAEYSETIRGDFNVEGPAIYLGFNNANGFLADGGRYHLFTPEATDPVTDCALRRLRPGRLSWRFGLATDDKGDLALHRLGS